MEQMPPADDDYSFVVGDLADATAAALNGWVHSMIWLRLDAAGRSLTERERVDVEAQIVDIAAETERTFRAFLALDVDDQRSNPLAVLRDAVRRPTEVLRSLGVAPVERGEFEQRVAPADIYDLAPATWRDVDESLHEPGLMWGVWKAATVISRRRAEGRAV
jgi:hypothetical protein